MAALPAEDSDVTASDSASETWSQTLDNIEVEDEVSITSNQELQEVADRLDSAMTLEPDTDIPIPKGDSSSGSEDLEDSLKTPTPKTDGVFAVPRAEEEEEDVKTPTFNGVFLEVKEEKPKPKTGRHLTVNAATEKKEKKENGEQKKKSAFQFLRKLTKFDKSKKPQDSEFASVRVDRLPMVFVVKYLGKQEIKGFCGLKYIRKPVDDMIAKVRSADGAKDRVELPLVYMIVSPKGIDIRQHKLNKTSGEGVTYGLIPIDFISYGVQDVKYWRVFTFILVKELGSRSKATECHAYLCDSPLNARRVALALGGAFRLYSRSLKAEGKVHNFQVELRPPDELADIAYKEYDV